MKRGAEREGGEAVRVREKERKRRRKLMINSILDKVSGIIHF